MSRPDEQKLQILAFSHDFGVVKNIIHANQEPMKGVFFSTLALFLLIFNNLLLLGQDLAHQLIVVAFMQILAGFESLLFDVPSDGNPGIIYIYGI
jgi:hypothetical protein